MTTLSDQIRRAALGPSPKPGVALWRWFGFGQGYYASRRALVQFKEFWDGTDTERRMFLLFVAEALEE